MAQHTIRNTKEYNYTFISKVIYTRTDSIFARLEADQVMVGMVKEGSFVEEVKRKTEVSDDVKDIFFQHVDFIAARYEIENLSYHHSANLGRLLRKPFARLAR
jgi:DNA polymerase elongation subunit (family B)